MELDDLSAVADQDKRDRHVAVLTAVEGLEQVVWVLLQQSGGHALAAVDHGQRKLVDIVVRDLSIQALDDVLPCCLQIVLLALQIYC